MGKWQIFLIYLRLYTVKILSGISPKMAASLFNSHWFRVIKPRAHKSRDEFLLNAKMQTVWHRDKELRFYKYEHAQDSAVEKRQQIMVVHGWSGRWDQMLLIIKSLYEAGSDVIFFDLPAHGENSGSSADLFEFSEFIESVSKTLGLNNFDIVCHSAGFLTVAHSKMMNVLKPNRIVAINSPAEFEYLFDIYIDKLGFSKKIVPELWRLIERRVRVDGAEKMMKTHHMSSIQDSNILIIHDQDDTDVDYTQSSKMLSLWPQAEFLKTKGLGHNRILRDREVISKITNFLSKY